MFLLGADSQSSSAFFIFFAALSRTHLEVYFRKEIVRNAVVAFAQSEIKNENISDQVIISTTSHTLSQMISSAVQ